MVVLAGDIGGTKTNLGLFVEGKTRPEPRVIETYSSRDAKNFAQIVACFAEKHPAEITKACFGIAGPVVKGRSKTTNLPWVVSQDQLQQYFNWPQVRLINDLEATAAALPFLSYRELYSLNKARVRTGENIALVAPGTGLGQALLIFHNGRYRVLASEGGHADFAPNNAAEIRLWEYLHRIFGHVSNERVLSGQGLVHIYMGLKASTKLSEPKWLSDKMEVMDPAQVITQTALDKKNRLCMKTVKMFVSILGAVAGNLALTGMTTGGVYLGGGISPKILPKINPGDFMAAFINKGRFKYFLEKIPVRVILNEKSALLGAAGCALEMAGHSSH
jgi:glucokinase